MEKKNTVLLTVIAVATLLVAVVGATFAYFTATATNTGTSGTVQTTTATVAGATLNIGSAEGKQYLEYPGGVGYSGVTLQAIKASGDTSGKEYDLTYQLQLTYTNTAATALNYKVYKVSTVTDPACKLHIDTTSEPGKTRYYYGKSDADPTACTVTVPEGTEEVASGQLATTGEAGTTITLSKNGSEVNFTSKTSDNDATTYYLVVEYPNSGDQTTGDMGKAISAQITGTKSAPVQSLATT